MDVAAIHRAALARSRLEARDDLQAGTVVYVWRCNKKIRGWVGPGVVICGNPTQTSVWVSMRGVVVKCSMDRVRRATDDEWLGSELIRVLSKDALTHMQRNGQRGYVDTAGEELTYVLDFACVLCSRKSCKTDHLSVLFIPLHQTGYYFGT